MKPNLCFDFIEIPQRSEKPRDKGLTMVMDHGHSLGQAFDLMEQAGDYIDIVKLHALSTRIQSVDLVRGKINMYKAYGCDVQPGGIFYEVAILQNRTDQFLDTAQKLGFTMIEVSDSVIDLTLEEKVKHIEKAKKYGLEGSGRNRQKVSFQRYYWKICH